MLQYRSALLSSKAKYVIGCDINDNYLTLAKQKYSNHNLEFIKIDLTKSLDLYRHSILTIVSFETIEHTPKPFNSIQKFYNILPIGGRLILSFPNASFEMENKEGKSIDSFHLSIIQFDKMIDKLTSIGFSNK